jgi:TldD protein
MTVRDVERAIRTALSRGGDWAELFWERSETLQLVLDDQRIEDAITGVDQGAGVRVVSGEQTVYANGNVTDVDDVMAIAGRAARSVADGSGPPRVRAARARRAPATTFGRNRPANRASRAQGRAAEARERGRTSS